MLLSSTTGLHNSGTNRSSLQAGVLPTSSPGNAEFASLRRKRGFGHALARPFPWLWYLQSPFPEHLLHRPYQMLFHDYGGKPVSAFQQRNRMYDRHHRVK